MKRGVLFVFFFLAVSALAGADAHAATSRSQAAADFLDDYEKTAGEETPPAGELTEESAGEPAEAPAEEALPVSDAAEPSWEPSQGAPSPRSEATTLPGGQVTMSGSYRMAAGVGGGDFILNRSNANQNMHDLQGPSYRYISGERLNNTFDPAIYSQHVVNVDFAPAGEVNIHTQVVNDPWSWVGTTGEQVQLRPTVNTTSTIRYNLKYIGAYNSTIGEVYRTRDGDRVNFPQIEVHDGQTARTDIQGLDAFLSPDGDSIGHTVNVPQLEIDYEYRPIRKLWVDVEKEQWKMRFFALADEDQALTTDDLLGLSNHKDYWEPSPWLYQYRPIQHFNEVGSIQSVKPGYYSDNLAVQARDSKGNRLVLLRGASAQTHSDRTSLEATVAAPFTPWDKHYFDADNVPGVVRLKHLVNDQWMLGGTYGFRIGRVDEKIADTAQVVAVDTHYQIAENVGVKGEMAASARDRDELSLGSFQTENDGSAFKAVVETAFDHPEEGRTDVELSYAQMGRHFESPLSRYLSTRDDKFWGNHIRFFEKPDVEPFRIGDGLDKNRMVFHMRWKEKRFKDKFYNLFDVRNVHKTHNTAYVETVWREEMTYKINDKLTAKGLFRWRDLPRTTPDVEPSLTSFYFPLDDVDPSDFTIRNTAVKADQNADQLTYSAGLQYVHNPQWTAEGIFERTNAIPDFPRGLLNDVFKDANERVDGILYDRMKVFLYGQDSLKAAPPYPYFNIIKGRLIHQPLDKLKFILHATHNGYKPAGGLDDNIRHAGLSASYDHSQKISFFADYTVSRIQDVPELIASGYTVSDYLTHHNVYFSMDYRVNAAAVFRAEYGVFGLGANSPYDNPYSSTTFSLPTIDTEHLLRLSFEGQF
ncbi:MAG: hypothetical protein HYT89_05900 [Candidatus Omnitrophica bacterium]|nr:hypothetical protein [Candidatus Omnitrophota bacterium]